MRHVYLIVALLCATELAACNQEAGPRIDLSSALTSSMDAIYDAHAETVKQAKARGYKKGIGIHVCQMSATFLVDVKNSTDNKLALSAGPAPAVVFPVPLGLVASTEGINSSDRSNTVTVLYTSDDCAVNAKGAGGGTTTKGAGTGS
jgi:predicted small secreted protein